ncbi:MAG TPA: hypothetical protein VG537_00560 [Candidatus Kapabacteria bacterium]|jgi:hypothetical protein|nr:hypothetical protein [Candidatus Kapabacteria bacterium]
MPRTSQRNSNTENDNHTAVRRTSRPRRRARSHSLAAEAERHVIRPAKRAVRNAAEEISDTVSDLPRWIPWTAAAVGFGILMYGLFQIESVRDFMRPVTEPVSEMFGEDDEYDADEFEDESEGSDYGSNYSSSGL